MHPPFRIRLKRIEPRLKMPALPLAALGHTGFRDRNDMAIMTPWGLKPLLNSTEHNSSTVAVQPLFSKRRHDPLQASPFTGARDLL
jgi:hypothetical protein